MSQPLLWTPIYETPKQPPYCGIGHRVLLSVAATTALDLDPVLVGSWPGTTWSGSEVAVAGDHAYLGGAGGLSIFDIGDPAHPWPLGHYAGPNLGDGDFAVSGDHAYLVSSGSAGVSELRVIDVSSPSSPRSLGFSSTLGDARRVAVAGGYAYVATVPAWDETAGIYVGGGMEIIDISQPESPRRVAAHALRGDARDIAVLGDYAYVIMSQWWSERFQRYVDGGLQVIDVTTPASPESLGFYDAIGDAVGVAVAGGYAYVATGLLWDEVTGINVGGGLEIIDVINPANPQRVGTFPTVGYASTVTVSDDYAYLGEQVQDLNTGRIHVIDVSNPESPKPVSVYDTSPSYPSALDISGGYAFVAEGILRVLDIRDPAIPVRVGTYNPQTSVEGLAVAGDHAYLAAGGLQVLDVSNPENPRSVGGLGTSGESWGVVVSGHHAYVADGWAGLQVIDISDPANPQRRGRYDTSGEAYAVAVSGAYAYVADGSAGLQVIDVSNPESPRWVGGYDTGGEAYAVAVWSTHAYVADGSAGLQVIDVSNPENPHWMSGYDTNEECRDVAVTGNYVYAVIPSGVRVIDVGNPANPVEVTRYDTARYSSSAPLANGSALSVAVSGNFAFVSGSRGLDVLDISNRTISPPRMGGFDPDSSTIGLAMAVSGRQVYAASGGALWVIDVSNPANPQRIAEHYTNGEARDVAVSGSYAYVANWWAGLQLVDVSSPTDPQWRSDFETGLAAEDVAVSAGYAFVAEFATSGFKVVDVRDPASPKLTGWYSGAFELEDTLSLKVSDNYAYAVVSFGLQVLDVSNPADPRPVGQYVRNTRWRNGQGVAVSGRHAYVTDEGLRVFDVTDPTNPYPTGSCDCDLSDLAHAVVVAGDYAYVTTPRAGLRVIDVSNPANPQLVGGYDTPGRFGSRYVLGVAVSGNYAYVASERTGLHVIDVSDPTRPRRVGGNSAFGARAVVVQGDYVYAVTTNPGRLLILNTFQPRPRLLPTFSLDASGFHFLLQAEPGRTVRLQRSSDLITWEDGPEFIGTGNPEAYSDESADAEPRRFYRAILP